jgi:hypothetical protein
MAEFPGDLQLNYLAYRIFSRNEKMILRPVNFWGNRHSVYPHLYQTGGIFAIAG